jgi:hypothetical protein
VDTFYPTEKFSNAAHSLAASTSDWRDRLDNAFRCVHTIVPQNLPEELQDRFMALTRAIKRVEAKHCEGTIKATIYQMPEEEGGRWMTEIHSIFAHLRHCEEEPRRAASATGPIAERSNC